MMVDDERRAMKLKDAVAPKGKIRLSIEKLVYGGDGFARYNGRACFVDGGVPGDELMAEVRTVKKQYLNASIDKIITPSLNRAVPPCPYVNKCGGCQWQHIDYDYQLAAKEAIVHESFIRLGSLTDVQINRIIPSKAVFNYRSRTIMQVDRDLPGLGYFMRNSHQVIRIDSCMLLESPINLALKKLKETLETIVCGHKVKDVEFLLSRQENRVAVSFNTGKGRPRIKPLIYDVLNDEISPAPEIMEQINDYHFKRSPGRFYQVNFLQNLEMINRVKKAFAGLEKPEILDLYCGCGNFSLFLAKNCSRVDGLDFDEKIVSEAKNNAKINGIGNCFFRDCDLSGPDFKRTSGSYDGILLNPPRTGASGPVIDCILKIQPRVIVYVSCNPATLSRDLKMLVKDHYRIESVQPVDMFPQTYHIETVVKLVKQ